MPAGHHPAQRRMPQRVQGDVLRGDAGPLDGALEDVRGPVDGVAVQRRLFVKTCRCWRGRDARTASAAGDKGIRRGLPFFVSRNVRASSVTCSQRSPRSSPARAPVISASVISARIFFGAASRMRALLVRGQDPRPPVVHLQPLHAARRGVDQLLPLNGLRQNRLQAIEFAIDRRRLQRIRCRRLTVCAPPARQAVPLPLLDPMRRDLVQHERPERLVERLEDLAVAIGALLVQVGVILQVRLGELPERDVRLPADAGAAVQNLRPLGRFDVAGQVLVGGLRACPVTPAVDAEVVVPVMAAARRRRAMQRVGIAIAQRHRLGLADSACEGSYG